MRHHLLRCTSPVLALLRPADGFGHCPLVAVDPKCSAYGQRGAIDPMQTRLTFLARRALVGRYCSMKLRTPLKLSELRHALEALLGWAPWIRQL
jgi:hypothetical protein